MTQPEIRFVRTVTGQTDDGQTISMRYSVEVLVTEHKGEKLEKIVQRHLTTEGGHIVGLVDKNKGRFRILELGDIEVTIEMSQFPEE